MYVKGMRGEGGPDSRVNVVYILGLRCWPCPNWEAEFCARIWAPGRGKRAVAGEAMPSLALRSAARRQPAISPL
eukprot:8468955-Lingulodinium_polyedra.AAC.1